MITEGAKDPHEILEILGPSAVQEYLIEEIQKVYRLQGVTISDKHLEVIISRMLFKVRITDTGDTDFFWGDQIDRFAFMDANDLIAEKGGKPAEGEPILLGITKASLETDSFISAASFQETTRVLTNAATLGKVDELKGFQGKCHYGPPDSRRHRTAQVAKTQNRQPWSRKTELAEEEASGGQVV